MPYSATRTLALLALLACAGVSGSCASAKPAAPALSPPASGAQSVATASVGNQNASASTYASTPSAIPPTYANSYERQNQEYSSGPTGYYNTPPTQGSYNGAPSPYYSRPLPTLIFDTPRPGRLDGTPVNTHRSTQKNVAKQAQNSPSATEKGPAKGSTPAKSTGKPTQASGKPTQGSGTQNTTNPHSAGSIWQTDTGTPVNLPTGSARDPGFGTMPALGGNAQNQQAKPPVGAPVVVPPPLVAPDAATLPARQSSTPTLQLNTNAPPSPFASAPDTAAIMRAPAAAPVAADIPAPPVLPNAAQGTRESFMAAPAPGQEAATLAEPEPVDNTVRYTRNASPVAPTSLPPAMQEERAAPNLAPIPAPANMPEDPVDPNTPPPLFKAGTKDTLPPVPTIGQIFPLPVPEPQQRESKQNINLPQPNAGLSVQDRFAPTLPGYSPPAPATSQDTAPVEPVITRAAPTAQQ